MATDMKRVTIRELRNRGDEVISRVAAGEHLTVLRNGRPVAELQPVRSRGLPAATLLEHWRHVPAIDPDELRSDIGTVIEPSL